MITPDYLRASDGTGDASLMRITSNRSIGSTVINVDTIVGVPEKFIAMSGTLLPTGFVDPLTVTNFSGHIDGTSLEIDEFAPGNTDNGNTENQVVVIKPNTDWANIVADLVEPLPDLYITQDTGWTKITEASTRVSDTSIDIIGDQRLRIHKGTKIRYTNNSVVKYGYAITNGIFSAGKTTYEITGGSDFKVVSAGGGTVTDVSYSNLATPAGFPVSFSWSAADGGLVGLSSVTAHRARFFMVGETIQWTEETYGTSNATNFYIDMPFTVVMDAIGPQNFGGFRKQDNSNLATDGLVSIQNNSKRITFSSNLAGAAWTNSGSKGIGAFTINFLT